MGNRTRKIIAVAVAALAVTTACGEGSGSSSAAGSASDARNPKAIASPDEVIKVVDKGFLKYRVDVPGVTNDYLSYGYVIENVSDEVALTVRTDVAFTNDAGKPIPDAGQGHEFSVVLPGQWMGVGDHATYADIDSGEESPAIASMNVRITLITALDTPDGKRYRKPPAPYAELAMGDPVSVSRNRQWESVAVEVTNTYDVPLRPKATAVVRDAEGVIVGGVDGHVMGQLQPGASVKTKFDSRPVDDPRLAEATVECYVDPNMGRMITNTPVWIDIS